MNSGKMNLTPGEVFNVVLGKGTEKQNLIVFEFRLPRIILAVLVGIGMELPAALCKAFCAMIWQVREPLGSVPGRGFLS